MKAIVYIISAGLFFLFSCQSAVAQPSPAITKKYSNAEIEKMVTTHKSIPSRDTYPSTVLSSQMTKDFPNSTDIEWEEASGIYEVEFEIGRTDYKAYYDSEANLLMYLFEIKEKDLPAIVKNGIVAKYPDHNIDNDPKKILKGTETYYIVEIEKAGREMKITLSSKGDFLKELID